MVNLLCFSFIRSSNNTENGVECGPHLTAKTSQCVLLNGDMSDLVALQSCYNCPLISVNTTLRATVTSHCHSSVKVQSPFKPIGIGVISDSVSVIGGVNHQCSIRCKGTYHRREIALDKLIHLPTSALTKK